MEGRSSCPTCQKRYTEDMIVGRTIKRSRGERLAFPVVLCICGTVYKGELLEEK
ncbi:MAG: hypothetical protein ACE5PM_09175 [Candidatus Hydrothermarchaeales archaeon]